MLSETPGTPARRQQMPRNFARRVELLIPIEDAAIKARLKDEVLGIMLADNVKTRVLREDGTYERVRPLAEAEAVRSQQRFIELARSRAARAGGVEPKLRLRPMVMLRPTAPRRVQREPVREPAAVEDAATRVVADRPNK